MVQPHYFYGCAINLHAHPSFNIWLQSINTPLLFGENYCRGDPLPPRFQKPIRKEARVSFLPSSLEYTNHIRYCISCWRTFYHCDIISYNITSLDYTSLHFTLTFTTTRCFLVRLLFASGYGTLLCSWYLRNASLASSSWQGAFIEDMGHRSVLFPIVTDHFCLFHVESPADGLG